VCVQLGGAALAMANQHLDDHFGVTEAGRDRVWRNTCGVMCLSIFAMLMQLAKCSTAGSLLGDARTRTRAAGASSRAGVFAAPHESEIGTKLPTRDVRYSVAIEGKADIHPGIVNRRE